MREVKFSWVPVYQYELFCLSILADLCIFGIIFTRFSAINYGDTYKANGHECFLFIIYGRINGKIFLHINQVNNAY